METIESILDGRDLIPWQDLSRCFKVSPRKMGVAFTTIQAWQAAGMPYVRDGRRLLFSWPEAWGWYKVYHHHGAAA